MMRWVDAARSAVRSLFGIEPAEPWVYSGTVAILIGIALLSALGPTLRALRIDPVETLRWP